MKKKEKKKRERKKIKYNINPMLTKNTSTRLFT